jgi:peroxiredoxin
MKKALYLTLLALIPAVLFSQTASKKVLPDFQFYNESGVAFNKTNLKKDIPVIVFYFDPDCDHCQQEAKWISAEMKRFIGIQMVWVAYAEPTAIADFGKKYFAGSYNKGAYFLRDKDYKFDKYFGYSQAPSIYVYNKKWELVKSFSNEIGVSDLLAPLKE